MALKLKGSTSGFTAIDAPAVAGDNTLVLPADNGSASQFLQTNGSGVLSWQTVTTPEILQVVHSRNATQGSVTNTTEWQDTGLSATITPTAAGSSILILLDQYVYTLNSTTNYTQHFLKLRRGTTDLDTWDKGMYVPGTSAHGLYSSFAVHYLDSPTYTLGNSVSYNTQVSAQSATNLTMQWNNSPSTMTLMEIAA